MHPAVALAGNESERPVVVIATPEPTPIIRRLQQEIEGLGFNVQLEPGSFAETPEVELSSRNAVAAIVISTQSPDRIVLYVLEPRTARIIKQELPIEAPKDPTTIELVATRTVELLRAARLEVSAEHRSNPPPPSQSPTPAPPTTRKELPTQQGVPAQLFIGVGTSVLYMPRWHLGTELELAAAYVGTSRFGWMSSLSSALSATTFVVSEVGRVQAKATTFRLGGLMQAIRPVPFGMRLYGGFEGSQVRFTGEVQSPYVSHATYLSTFAPFIGIAANLRLSSDFQLTAEVSSSWALPRTAVRYSGQELRDWGRPSVHGALTVEWQSL